MPEKFPSPENKDAWALLKEKWEASPDVTLRDRSVRKSAAANAINTGHEQGAPIEEIDKFAKEVISQSTEHEIHGFIYAIREYVAATNDEEMKALGAKAYEHFLKTGDTGSARELAKTLYGVKSKEYRRVEEAEENGSEEGPLLEISNDATFADLFVAMDRFEGDPDDLRFEAEVLDNFGEKINEEVLALMEPKHADRAATIKVLEFFKERGYSQSEVEAYLPIKFKRAGKKKK